MYADVFARCYGYEAIGLRYFNVFGPRQDPDGAYAAVIPKWLAAMLRGEAVAIHGDGSNSRDFCYVANAVQANLLAALAPRAAKNAVYNIAVGERCTLSQLFDALRSALRAHGLEYAQEALQLPPRAGDVRHSLADISRARERLGYAPRHRLVDGLALAMPWYLRHAQALPAPAAGSGA
jgi:UDP-N-acetylglucosamine 4-epimerase